MFEASCVCAFGRSWISVLDRDALRSRFPWLSVEGVALGSFGERNEGYFDPWALLELTRTCATKLGVRFLKADALRIERGGVVALADGSQFHAGVVVNAAGAHAAALFGDEVSPPLPVAPRKRCIFAVSCPLDDDVAAERRRPPKDAPLTIDPSGVYFRGDLREGRFLCGVSPPADRDPDVLTRAELENVDHSLFEDVIWPTLANRVPAFEALRVEASWAGLYEYCTLDQNGIVGNHPTLEGCVVAAGFSGHGLQHSPGIGRAVAELIDAGKFETIDLEPFGFERILRNEPIFETGIY